MSPRTRPARAAALLAALAAAVLLAGCGDGRKKIRVFAADALAASFKELKHEFEQRHPDTNVVLDIEGSIIQARLAPLRRVDVVALADHRLVEKILAPDHARWVAKFASTEIVLARTEASQYQTEINTDNWYEILLRPDVSYAIADPSQDPCGYYTHLAWRLAEKHYFTSKGKSYPLAQKLIQGCPREHIALNALKVSSEFLETSRVDYAFLYKSHCRDLNLPFIPLPPQVSLGRLDLAEHYATISADVPNYRGGAETVVGTPIAFGLTIPPDAPNLQGAQEFVKFILSDEGQTTLKRSDFVPIAPALVPDWPNGEFPDFLAPDLAKPEGEPGKPISKGRGKD